MKKQYIVSIIGAIVLVAAVAFFVVQSSPPGSVEWQNLQNRIYPQLTRVSSKQVMPLVYDEFTDDLDIGYVIDKEDSYDFIMQEQLEAWGISQETLRKTAMANLEEKAKQTEFDVGVAGEEGDEKYVIIETVDGYAATRILSENIRNRIAAIIGSPFAAAVPVRDFMIAWPSEFSIGYQFVEEVEKAYADGGLYKLSKDIYKATPETVEDLP